MAIVVEHDKRKHEILQKSLDVFVEQGYEDATFQKIADHCGITRTTLYIYFKNKHEIFLGSIKELLSELETNLRDMRECREELGAQIRVLRPFMDVTHEYPELTVHLTLFESEMVSGEVHRLSLIHI